MSRENKMIIDENGEEQWISRSDVVIALVCRFVNEDIQILVEKRGPAVSATGKWCIPCGYLDYDEDLTDAVVREIREETGYIVQRNWVHFVNINSEPKGKKQNVHIRHIVFLDENQRQIENFKMDEGEVTDLKWVTIGKIEVENDENFIVLDKEAIYGVGEWAFNQPKNIINIFDEYIKNDCPSQKLKVLEKLK